MKIVDFWQFYPGFTASIGELYALKSLDLIFGSSSEFSECLDKIPVRILLDVLFREFRFSKASSNAPTSLFIKFKNFVAILALKPTRRVPWLIYTFEITNYIL